MALSLKDKGNIDAELIDGIDSSEFLLTSALSDDAYGEDWDGVTDVAPSQNAVHDELKFREYAHRGACKLKVAAGRVNFSWNNATGRLWRFPAGTVIYGTSTPITMSTAEKPDVTIPAGGGEIVLYGSFIGGYYALQANNTGKRFVGSLADLPAVSYTINLQNCSETKGDLSDLPAVSNLINLSGNNDITGKLADVASVTFEVNLGFCYNITGDVSDLNPSLASSLNLSGCNLITGKLADVPRVNNYFNINGCNLITGDLADAPSVTNTFNVGGCPLITGDLADVSLVTMSLNIENCSLVSGEYTAVSGTNVPTYTTLSYSGMSTTDVDNTLIAYAACSKTYGYVNGYGLNRTAASDTAVSTLTGRGVAVNGFTKI